MSKFLNSFFYNPTLSFEMSSWMGQFLNFDPLHLLKEVMQNMKFLNLLIEQRP